jgi:arabinose-5-phosphate isomerase
LKLAKNIKSSAIKVLQTEANAIQNPENYIDVEFVPCVEAILTQKTR